MRLKGLLSGALALSVLAGCSNEDLPTNGGQTVETPGGYLAFNIQLPTVAGTRAINDNYDDGTTNEYHVDNAAIVIFKGTDEMSATVAGAYVLYDMAMQEPDNDNDNITTRYSKVAKIDGLEREEEDKLFALAILNYNPEVISCGDNGELMVKTANSGTNPSTAFTGTFAELLEAQTSHQLYNGESRNSDKFFMTNAPLSSAIGSKRGTLAPQKPEFSNVRTLVEFDPGKIHDTEADAKKDPAASIYVERAVAKATLESVPTSATIGNEKYDIKLWGWYVDNTEPTSYIIRNLGIGNGVLDDYLGYTTGGDDYEAYKNYRFVGTEPMGQINNETPENLYRIYWCADPQYNGKGHFQYNTYFVNGITTENGKLFQDKDYIFYPHENTFSVANQSYHNTTRAVFRMTIAVGGDNKPVTFFTLNDDENNLYTNIEDATSVIWGYLTDDEPSTDTPGSGAVNGHNSDIREAFKAALNEGKSFSYGKSNISITFSHDAETGVYSVTDINLVVSKEEVGADKTFKVDPNVAFAESASKKALISYINSTWRILQYTDGHSYYDLRFMHFADAPSNGTYGPNDLAPWKWAIETPETSKITTEQAYGNDTNSEPYYLGRYGMVRNNWYSVSIGNVFHLGSPVPPKVQNVNKSDDNHDVHKYLSFKINILSWAKRSQNVDF
ncbi:MAG: fimbria major subunit [Muribaculaceae bacterium]|nr:fimbria major subunit [Muribaculaceae bacterium]